MCFLRNEVVEFPGLSHDCVDELKLVDANELSRTCDLLRTPDPVFAKRSRDDRASFIPTDENVAWLSCNSMSRMWASGADVGVRPTTRIEFANACEALIIGLRPGKKPVESRLSRLEACATPNHENTKPVCSDRRLRMRTSLFVPSLEHVELAPESGSS